MLDITQLTQPLDATAPCGEDPEYASLFVQMEKAREGEPERVIGSAVIQAVEADWKLVKKLALQLFSETRDLRVATHLCAALLHTDGLPGFRDGLAIIAGLLGQVWDCIHPELDPDDANPAIMRGNTLLALTAHTFLVSLKRQPLINTKIFGKFSINDLQEAQQYKTSGKKEEQQQYQRTEAAFKEAVETNILPDILDTLNACQQHIGDISGVFQDKVGYANAPSLAALKDVLDIGIKLIEPRIPAQVPPPPLDNAVTSRDNTDENNAAPTTTPHISNRDDPMNIQNRDDVLEALKLICEYYAHHEPGSPVPLILERARNLVNKDFMGILQDLSPESASQVGKLFGLKGEKS